MTTSNNTTHYLVTCTCRDPSTDKWFTWTSRVLKESQIEDAIDNYHAKQLEKNCTLEGVRITSVDDPRFPSVWQKLVDDRNMIYKAKFHQLSSEFKDSIKVELRFQSEAFRERRNDLLIIHAQKKAQARSIMEAKQRGE